MTNSTITQQNSKHPAIFRVSLKSLLAMVAFSAMIFALILQQFELSKTRASLARYETSLIPTALSPNEFRVIANEVLQTDHATVIRFRIESLRDHFATISKGTGRNGGRSTFDPKTNLYVTEAVLFVDHIKSQNVMKVMFTVSGAQGYSVEAVADDFSLAEAIFVHGLEVVYSRGDTAILLELNGSVCTLDLKS